MSYNTFNSKQEIFILLNISKILSKRLNKNNAYPKCTIAVKKKNQQHKFP